MSFAQRSGCFPTTHAIAAATLFGLVEGDTAPDGSWLGTFLPDEEINRAEVAKIVSLASKLVK